MRRLPGETAAQSPCNFTARLGRSDKPPIIDFLLACLPVTYARLDQTLIGGARHDFRALWEQLPSGFLKKSYSQWRKLDLNVRELVVSLAREQNFKCIFCDRHKHLILEHDHEPQEGPWFPITIYNIRGIVCSRCNWHLMVYKKSKNDEYLNWENAESYISDSEYERYIYSYELRVGRLIEEALEKRLGSRNYWRRRRVLQRFDEWYYEGGDPPASWIRFKENQAMKIRSPEDFVRIFAACAKFVAAEIKKNSSYEPPMEFLKIAMWFKRLIEDSREVVPPEPNKRLKGGVAV